MIAALIAQIDNQMKTLVQQKSLPVARPWIKYPAGFSL